MPFINDAVAFKAIDANIDSAHELLDDLLDNGAVMSGEGFKSIETHDSI